VCRSNSLPSIDGALFGHSTKVRIADDRNGRRASRVADKLNAELEASWRDAVRGRMDGQFNRYDEAPRRSRTLGFEHIEHDLQAALPEKLVERLEALRALGLAFEPGVRQAVLGTEKRALFLLSKLPKNLRQSSRTRSATSRPISSGFGGTAVAGRLSGL
jgi:hypothetical protein